MLTLFQMFPDRFAEQKSGTPQKMHVEAVAKKVFDRVMENFSDKLQQVSHVQSAL